MGSSEGLCLRSGECGFLEHEVLARVAEELVEKP